MTTEKEKTNNINKVTSSDIVSDIESNGDGDGDSSRNVLQQQQEHSTTTTTTTTTIKSSSTRQDLIDVLALKVVKQFTVKAEQPLIDTIKKNILPKNSESVRKLPFYNTTLNAIKFQRDNYLVGNSYANNNKNSLNSSYSNYSILNTRMPLDSTCLGHIQIVQLGSWFVPSTTIKDALLPIVVALPTNTLYKPIVDIVSNAIPLGQPLLDSAVKYSLIQFLQDPKWRYVIKTQTKGYIGDDPNESSN